MSSPATGPLQNLYHKRAVAASSAKPCTICYKATTVVLITPDSRDFFYVCAGHLNDKGFASPAPGEGRDLQKEREEAFAREIEKVKAEYAAKVAKRKAKKEEPKKDAAKDDKADKSDADERDKKVADLEKKKDAGEDAPASGTGTGTTSTDDAASKEPALKDETARIFTLHRSIFQMRASKLQQAAAAKRRAEQLRNPNFFPAVPKGP